MYSATEPLVRFVVLQLFSHCGAHCLIHSVGTGRFDDYISFCHNHALSAKHRICAPWPASRNRHLRDMFAFI